MRPGEHDMPEHDEGIIIDAPTAVRLAQEVLASDRATFEAIAIAEYLLGLIAPDAETATLAEEDEG
jgi:hypothetical protein